MQFELDTKRIRSATDPQSGASIKLDGTADPIFAKVFFQNDRVTIRFGVIFREKFLENDVIGKYKATIRISKWELNTQLIANNLKDLNSNGEIVRLIIRMFLFIHGDAPLSSTNLIWFDDDPKDPYRLMSGDNSVYEPPSEDELLAMSSTANSGCAPI